jgi:V/A-type H+-transporting ATPase subunit D
MSDLRSPTRMELIKLRERLTTTRRGHKLLKDKQDELIHQFIDLIKVYKALRIDVENKLQQALYYYKKASVKMSQKEINELLGELRPTTDVSVSTYKMMGVVLPKVEVSYSDIENETYNYLETTAAFDYLLSYSRKLLSYLLELVEIETKVEKMIDEIEKSKRRVNAIENIVIKEIEEEIRVIRMKLSDMERSNTIRMMKSKEIIINKYKENQQK